MVDLCKAGMVGGRLRDGHCRRGRALLQSGCTRDTHRSGGFRVMTANTYRQEATVLPMTTITKTVLFNNKSWYNLWHGMPHLG
jgi:hypothetical protein